MANSHEAFRETFHLEFNKKGIHSHVEHPGNRIERVEFSTGRYPSFVFRRMEHGHTTEKRRPTPEEAVRFFYEMKPRFPFEPVVFDLGVAVTEIVKESGNSRA